MPDSTGATVLDDLPELILIEEIFLRLPSEDVLRCRAVRRSWHSATSTHKFMLDHHARQLPLPIIEHMLLKTDGVAAIHLHTFHRDAHHALRPVIRCATPGAHALMLHGAVDGLLLVSIKPLINCYNERHFYVCNPATRQCAPVKHDHWEHSGFRIIGFYRHYPSGEYRVLYFIINAMDDGDRSVYYVLTLGSVDEPRCIWSELPPAPPDSLEDALLKGLPCISHNCGPPPVLQCGSLHWIVPPLDEEQPASDAKEIQEMVAFDTAGETFRWMSRPAQPGPWPLLFEVDGAIALCGTGDGTSRTAVELWVMQDYEAGVWAPILQITCLPSPSPLDVSRERLFVWRMVVFNEHEFLIRFLARRLWHCHTDGKLLINDVVKCDDIDDGNCGMEASQHFLKESILPLSFFGMREEDREHPFILGT